MQAEKADTETEKNEANQESTVTPVTNEVANLKIEDGSGSSAPSSPGATSASGSFLASFKAFSKFGDPKSDGKLITLSQSDKWMKQAKVIDGKKITTTDTGIFFKKQKAVKLGVEQYKAFLEELAKSKKVDLVEMKKKMASCGPPGVTAASSAVSRTSCEGQLIEFTSGYNHLSNRKTDRTFQLIAGRITEPLSIKPRTSIFAKLVYKAGKAASTVDRLTDVSKYTGSHKQRFDETGKGKGIAGRKDIADQSGYVQGYQNKDTYNKAH